MSVEIGVLAVRRSIWIDATPERVWREFESFERMSRWFGVGHRLLTYEPRVGGWVELEVDLDGKPTRFGGRVIAFEPGREVTFEDDWIPSWGWAAPSLITIRLTAALGGTVVELFHHGFERVGPTASAELRGFEGGWTTRQLEALYGVIERAAA